MILRTVHCLCEAAEARTKRHNISQVLKELSTTNSIYSKTILRKKRGNETILREGKLKESVMNSLHLEDWLKKFLQIERTWVLAQYIFLSQLEMHVFSYHN